MASVQAHGVVQRHLALALLLVSRIHQPAVRLQEDGRPQVLLRIPPVGRARRRAARAEDALVETVELLAVRLALSVFLALGVVLAESPSSSAGVWWAGVAPAGEAYIGSRRVPLQIRLDGLVLFVEERQVRHEILDDVGVRKGVDLDFRSTLGRDSALAQG